VSTISITFDFSCVLFDCPGRHDNPEEKLDDEIRAQINASHRFGSFADQRLENAIKWYVFVHMANSDVQIPFRHIDGHDYMYALSEMLDSAKECIFILVCLFETIAIASSRYMRCHRTGGSPLSYIFGWYLDDCFYAWGAEVSCAQTTTRRLSGMETRPIAST
jgi:hypothetical protein